MPFEMAGEVRQAGDSTFRVKGKMMKSPPIGRRQFALGAAALAFAARPAFAFAQSGGGGLDGVVRHARAMGVRG